ncbi:MAG: M10 family metallopeptidase [Pseudomonadota bacterium]
MTSKDAILEAMQFSQLAGRTLNTTNAPALTITYEFAGNSKPDDLWTNSLSGWRAFDADEKAAIRDALAHFETIINVDFVEVSGAADPDFNFGMISLPGPVAGQGGWNASFSGGEIVLDSFAAFDKTLDITRLPSLIIHEIGHGLGLKHPFEGPSLPANEENNKYTVMSYSANPDNGRDSDALMLYDIVALQDLWGEAENNEGNTTYNGRRTTTVDSIWDTGGTDTLDATGFNGGVTLRLKEGAFSQFGNYEDVSIAFGTVIENAKGGGGADEVYGNQSANLLQGGAGNDKLVGRRGFDTLEGQTGNDKMFAGGGRDELKGGTGADLLRGGQGSDTMWGGADADRFMFRKTWDNDKVMDFEDDIDVLLLKGFGFGNAAQALDTARQAGDNVIFEFGDNDMLTVRNTSLGALEDDIIV